MIVALSSRVGFLEQELEDMDRCVAQGNCPPSPVARPPPVMIDLTDESDEEPDVILVEDDDEELIGGLIKVEVQVWIETPPPQDTVKIELTEFHTFYQPL